MVKMYHGRYYYKFLRLVEKLRNEDDSCFICGSTMNVQPHHLQRFKENDQRYADESNVVLLCGKHHHLFHKCYGSGKGVNPKNFSIFVKKEFEKLLQE